MPRRKSKTNKKTAPKKSIIETKVEKIIKSLNLPYQDQMKIGKYTVDFLIDDRYIVECYGDFWHCNPTKYTGSFFNRGAKKTAEEIWNRDRRRKLELEQMGYKFMCVWEEEVNASSKLVSSRIKKILNVD